MIKDRKREGSYLTPKSFKNNDLTIGGRQRGRGDKVGRAQRSGDEAHARQR